MSRLRAGDERGFTIVELLVVMLLIGIIGSIVTTTVVNAMGNQRRQIDQLQSLNQAKTAFERFTRDVRGANPLLDAQNRQVTVELNHSGVRRTITYEVDGEDFVRTEVRRNAATGALLGPAGGTTQVLLSGLTVPAAQAVFTYIDRGEDGARNMLTPPVNTAIVNGVGVQLTIRVLDRPRPIALKNEITLRNGEVRS